MLFFTSSSEHPKFLIFLDFCLLKCLNMHKASVFIGILQPITCILHPASCILHPASCILHPASCILHPASCILHPASCILHPASCILHPASCILHPATCSLHPPSCNLQFAPSIYFLCQIYQRNEAPCPMLQYSSCKMDNLYV